MVYGGKIEQTTITGLYLVLAEGVGRLDLDIGMQPIAVGCQKMFSVVDSKKVFGWVQ